MSEEVAKTKSAGVACLVDAGHADMGRDINFIRQVSMKSGVPIVAGGGFYSQPFYPKEISTMSEEQIVKSLIKQADDDTLGVYGEIGSWDEITADERKVFRSVGKAHLATNLSIFTHTGIPGKSALEQLDLLEDAGVKPDRIVIGHLGNLVDPNVYVHKAICRRGAFVGFDRQGGNGDARGADGDGSRRGGICKPSDVLGRRVQRILEDDDGFCAEIESGGHQRCRVARHYGRQSSAVSRVCAEAASARRNRLNCVRGPDDRFMSSGISCNRAAPVKTGAQLDELHNLVWHFLQPGGAVKPARSLTSCPTRLVWHFLQPGSAG